ncbi:MAG: hypothetical protein HY935_00190, partial [Nitrosomonadales bacterium]|nr:hypothetical protein [Nitrosomonadales bacterium]
ALLLMAPLAQAAVLYVQSVKAPILSDTSFGSPKLAEATKGEALKEVESKGSWHKVIYKDKTGWVSRLLIGPKPPVGRVSVLEGTSENLESGARKRASAFTTAAAARGFAEDRSRVSDKYKTNFGGVERMEAVKISDEVAMTFLQEGVEK